MLSWDPSPAPVPESLLAHLAQLPDPRIERTKHHPLVDKHGLKARRLNTAWDPDYLLKLLRFATLEPRKD